MGRGFKIEDLPLKLQEQARAQLSAPRRKNPVPDGEPERHKTTWKQGWREIGGYKKYYRSLWEANYARYLEFLKTSGEISDWKHEPKTFWFDGIKRGCVSYLPDFWIKNNDGSEEYHEVKGWMDDRSKTKIDRMAKYHPSTKLVVVKEKQYKEIKNKISGAIRDWE